MISATFPRHSTAEVNHLVTRGRYMIAGCQTFILNRRSNVVQVDESKSNVKFTVLPTSWFPN